MRASIWWHDRETVEARARQKEEEREVTKRREVADAGSLPHKAAPGVEWKCKICRKSQGVGSQTLWESVREH